MIISNIIVAFCLLTVINVKPIKTSNSTKCHRLCVCLDLTTVDCSNKSLTSVPDNLPVGTRTLLLKHNRIKSLSSDSFLGLRNLTEVDLSGNNLDCNCSLAWLKNASSSNIRLKATCENPLRNRGNSINDISMDDMCKIPSSTRVAITSGRSTRLHTSTTPHPTTTPAITTTKKPATSSKILTTTVKTPTTQGVPKTTTLGRQTTTVKSQTTTVKPQTTTVNPQTTTVKPQTTTVNPETTTTDTPTTVEDKPTTTKVSVPRPTHHRANGTSPPPAPTDRQNRTDPANLTGIVEMSSKKDLNAESLRHVIEMLERVVERQNYSDSKTTTAILLVSSNLMEKENRKSWSTVNKNTPAGENLLKIINKAMGLLAVGMLKSTTNNSRHFSVNHSNLEAEIYVDVGEKLAEKEIQFPSIKSAKNDYVTFSKSSFKTAGKNNVAVIGMKSAELGDLLPRRSLIDDFDSFKTGSGVLSASVRTLKGNISSSVRISFNNKGFLGNDEELTKCAFWKHENAGKNGNKKASSSAKSGWSDEGCKVISRNRSTTICHCDHMTDFAVLTQSIQVVPKPTIIMYIAGLCLLFGAMIALIRNIFVWRKTRSERLSVLGHECLAFILAAVVFLLGLFLDYHQAMCMIFAALLHWFVLAIFCWILAEFLQLYMSSHFGWNRSSSRLKYFAILGWVLPLVLVAITLAITRENEYGSTQWCWYSDSEIILLTYVVPIVLCILFSIMVILKIACFKSDATDDGEKRDLSVVMALSAFLIPLVLCAFTMAALSADDPEEDIFQYLFAMFCILVAIYIMVYHCWLDREVMKLSVRKNVQRPRPKRDYYSTKETVMYSEGTSEGKSFSLIFPSRKSPEKKSAKPDRKSAKRSDSSSPFDYNSTVPMYPGINDSSLKSFKSQVSTQQHTLDTPPNTLTAITISRPNSQCIELTSPSDLDRRPDGAEQTDAGEPSEFYGSRHSNPMDSERQRTSGCSTDCTNNASTFGKDKVVPKPSETPGDNEGKNRISGASSVGLSRTSRSSMSGASQTAAGEENLHDDGFEDQPFIRCESNVGPEIRSDPPAKIPKRRKRGSRRRFDDDFHDDETDELKPKATRQSSSTLPSEENPSVKLKHYTSF